MAILTSRKYSAPPHTILRPPPRPLLPDAVEVVHDDGDALHAFPLHFDVGPHQEVVQPDEQLRDAAVQLRANLFLDLVARLDLPGEAGEQTPDER